MTEDESAEQWAGTFPCGHAGEAVVGRHDPPGRTLICKTCHAEVGRAYDHDDLPTAAEQQALQEYFADRFGVPVEDL